VGINNAREVHFLKFAAPSNLSDLSIQWHFARVGSGTNTLPTAAAARDDLSKFLVFDSNDPTQFYLFGKYAVQGSEPSQ